VNALYNWAVLHASPTWCENEHRQNVEAFTQHRQWEQQQQGQKEKLQEQQQQEQQQQQHSEQQSHRLSASDLGSSYSPGSSAPDIAAQQQGTF
jgi:DNA anti-recombination protein RmuC